MQFIKKLCLSPRQYLTSMSTAMKGQISSKSVGGGKLNVEGAYCTSLQEHTGKFQESKITVISCVEQRGETLSDIFLYPLDCK